MSSRAKREADPPRFLPRTSLAVFTSFCQTSQPMCRLLLYSNRRALLAAAILSLPFVAGGCARWDQNLWNLDRFRDERAVDIEKRLERDEPIVKNPF